MGKNSNSGNDGTMRLVRFLLLALLLLPRGILGTIMLPEFNRSFKSMPAIFGQRLDIDDPVSLAHLQLIKELPLLCEEEKGLNNSAAESDVVTPSHGLPVALLVQRGSCTFYEKTQLALLWDPVQYVIIYDNEISPQLVPISSKYTTNMTLLFVSYHSGMGKKIMCLV
jgi:hypothetical protein